MIFSDKGTVFEEGPCEKAPILKEMTLPTLFQRVQEALDNRYLCTFSALPPTPTSEPFRV